MTILLDGKACAQQIEAELRQRALKLAKKPILATILVGDDPASATYVRMKGNACERVGIGSLPLHLPASTTTDQLLTEIQALNRHPDVRGVLLQHPVPHHIDERRCFDAIDAAKDVDGVTSAGFGRMALGEKVFGSATPQGIMTLLQRYQIPIRSRHAVVIGRSAILGKPMAAMLLNADATVTICHSKTERLAEIVKQADIVVAALGKREFVRAAWVRDGAVVVDAGYHPPGIGDVELAPLKDRVAAYTPVPGGVGPMTIATLIQQTIEAAEISGR